MTTFMAANIKLVLLFALIGATATLSRLGRGACSRLAIEIEQDSTRYRLIRPERRL